MRTVKQSIIDLKHFVGSRQINALYNATKGEEGKFFTGKLDEIATRIANMPKTYDTNGRGDDAIAYLHYFIGGCDWYITEKDMGDGTDDLRQHQAFGIANLGYGYEWGYISINELLSLNVELDLYSSPCAISEVLQAEEA